MFWKMPGSWLNASSMKKELSTIWKGAADDLFWNDWACASGQGAKADVYASTTEVR